MDRVSVVNAVKNVYEESIDFKAALFLAKNPADAPLLLSKLLEGGQQGTVWQLLDLKSDPLFLLSRAGTLSLHSATGQGSVTLTSGGKEIIAATVITSVESQIKLVVQVDKDGQLIFSRLHPETLQVESRNTLQLPSSIHCRCYCIPKYLCCVP